MAIPGHYYKFWRIPGQLTHPGHFRDNSKKSGSVPDVPGRLATMRLEWNRRLLKSTRGQQRLSNLARLPTPGRRT